MAVGSRSFAWLFLASAVCLFLVSPASAEIVVSSSVNISNTSTALGLNVSSYIMITLANAHLAWNGTEQPNGGPSSLSNPSTARRLFALNGVRLMPFGPNVDFNNLPSMLPEYSMFMETSFPLYAIGDGIAFAIPISGNYIYGVLKVDAFQGHSNLTVSYRFNNQSGNRTIGSGAGVGSNPCGGLNTESQCATNPGCFWDFGLSFCKQKDGGGMTAPGGGFKPDCHFFNGFQNKCQNATVCVWSSGTQMCDNNGSTFNFTSGLVCANLNETGLCGNMRDLWPLCSWNVTSCIANNSKSFMNFAPPPVQFCEAATNQTVCNQLANEFSMPCTWKTNNISNTSECGFKFENIFGGDVKNMFDITTQSSCEAAGGTYKTESFQSTNTYGQTVTQSKSWCEFDFGYGGGGFSKQSCNDACWACEQNGTSAWPTVAAAQNACEGSALGFCKWINNTNTPNGKGFCSPDAGLSFGGGGDCSSSCGACFKSSICATSAANCSWVPDPFSFDLNGDGSFDNLTDGFCEVKAIAFKKDCSQTCNACMSPALCSSSAAPSGCSWNMTSSGFPVCVPTGPPQEICFVPGDEDGDGLADCLDTNSTGGSCTQNPFCGFGASGAGVSGPMGGMGAFDSQLCIQWDNNQTGCLGQKGPVAASMENQSVCFFHPAPGQQFSPTNGWCDPLFNQQLSGGMGVDKPPTIVGTDVLNDVVEPYLDIGPVGVHESPGKADKFDLGMALRNVSTAAWCKKSYPGSINLSSLFLRYLDVDENISNGCALESNASSLGWDYKFRYFENATSGEIKIAFRCVNSSWAPMVAQTVIMKDMCLMQLGGPGGGPGPGPGGPPGGAVLDFANISAVNIMIINKADIGNPKKVQRFFVATGNQSRNESNPVDVAGPYYYTPGSIDVKFENCAIPNVDEDGDGLVSDNDPDCQSFMKQGYISFEVGPQCQDGVDNDGNGKTDCADQSCKYDPIGLCNSGQGMVCDSTDKKSPALKWLDVKTFPDFASIKFDSDEPANGTVQYYGNDSACNSINTTVLDFALLNAITNDNYKPWHDVQLGQGTLNLSLTANRTYYYKFVMTDLCNNKVTSACLNFTTTTTYSSFVFKPVPPSGLFIDIPELGVSNDNFTYAKQYNASQTKDITLKIKDPSNGFTIELQNASVLKASTLNISTLFINSGGEEYVGMNTSTWSKIQTDMFPSTINITIPDNGTGLFKCDEGNLSNCVNVSSIATCTFGTVNTTCVIPLSSGTGFSVYKVAGTQASSGSSSPSSSTSTTTTAGGGGGGVSNVTTVKGRTDSGVQKLAPGNGLRTNAKLLAAIEKVLARGKLASPAVDNLVALSDAVATDTSVEKEFNSVSGKTTITAKLKYSGKKKAMNFMVHETLPKTFANNASLITVSAPGATVTIANPDPEFVLTYPEVSEGQILTVTYTVAKDLKSILADTATAVFADELVEVPVEAPAEPAAETTAEEPQAAVPETQAQDQTGLLLGLVVVVALVVGFVLYQSKKKK